MDSARISVVKNQWIPWLMCGLGTLFYLYESILRISPSVMNTDLMLHFHINAGKLSHLIAFYYYIYAPMQIVVGLLMDRYGPRRLLSLAALCCLVGTYLFAVTDLLIVAELGRFLIGFGSAFAFVGVLKLATIWLPADRFAVVSGMVMALGMVGGYIGDMGLTALVSAKGWYDSTMILVGVGVMVTLLLMFCLRSGMHRLAANGNLTFGCVLKNLMQIIKNPQLWINGVIGCLMWLPISIFAESWGISYLHYVHGFSRLSAANANAMVFLGWAIGGPLVGMFSEWLKQRRLPIILGAALAAVCVSIVLCVPNLSYWTVSFLLLFFGIFNSAQVIVFAVSRELVGQQTAGTAIAITNMFVMIAGIIQPLSGWLLDYAAQGVAVNGAAYSAHAYKTSLSVLPIGLALTVVLGLFLKETYGSTD